MREFTFSPLVVGTPLQKVDNSVDYMMNECLNIVFWTSGRISRVPWSRVRRGHATHLIVTILTIKFSVTHSEPGYDLTVRAHYWVRHRRRGGDGLTTAVLFVIPVWTVLVTIAPPVPRYRHVRLDTLVISARFCWSSFWGSSIPASWWSFWGTSPPTSRPEATDPTPKLCCWFGCPPPPVIVMSCGWFSCPKPVTSCPKACGPTSSTRIVSSPSPGSMTTSHK